MRSALLTLCMASGLFSGLPLVAYAADAAPSAPEQTAANAAANDRFASVRQQIQQALKNSGDPSVAVAVAQNGKIIWEEAFGWADIEKKIPATVDTLYSLASITKPMTETGLMVLVERGKLDLDAPVNQYLAKDAQMTVWIGDPKEVTLRRLMNHTAGLPRHENFYQAHEISSMPAMDESIRRYGNIVTPPGERYRYSNFGYGILSHVIARTSGMSYADFMRNEVFLPLGMTHSSVGIAPELAEFAASRYDENNQPIPFYSFDHEGASGAWCSMHDLVKFGMFQLGQLAPDQKAILSRETVAAMNIRGSGGAMGGVYTTLRMVPNQSIVVAVVSNKYCNLPDKVQDIVLSAVDPGYAERMAQRERRPRNTAATRDAQPEFKVTPELLGEWEGKVHTYAGNYSMTLSFKESGEVYAKLEKQLQTLVTDLRFTDGQLTGRMAGRIDTGDTRRRAWEPEHHIDLDLKLRGDVINGAVTTIAGNALSYWVELRKKY